MAHKNLVTDIDAHIPTYLGEGGKPARASVDFWSGNVQTSRRYHRLFHFSASLQNKRLSSTRTMGFFLCQEVRYQTIVE